MSASTSKRVCLFGVGALLSSCYNQILLYIGRKPDLLCDNDTSKWGRDYHGVICVSPAELEKEPDIDVFITVRNFEVIAHQLYQKGINNVYALHFDKEYNVLTHSQKVLTYFEYAQKGQKGDLVDLAGQWAIVTGASRGIGLEIAKSLVLLGVNIVAVSTKSVNCKTIQEFCLKNDVQCLPLGVQLASTDFMQKIAAILEQKKIHIDILVNCAGVAPRARKDIWYQLSEDFEYTYKVNVIAPILLCSYFIPKMITRQYGRIVNISSNIHHRPAEQAYACSKAALDKYIYDLQPTIDKTGVLMSVVDPGWVSSDMGGEQAPNTVASVIPGAILGILMKSYKNGQWFFAQDYAELTLSEAVHKAKYVLNQTI